MNDLISRQALLDEFIEHRSFYCSNRPEDFRKLPMDEKIRVDEIDTAIAMIVNSPSTKIEMVSRQDVIDELYSWEGHCMTEAEEWHLKQVIGSIRSLPSLGEEMILGGQKNC